MKYEKVEDPEGVAREALRTEARQKEELAFAAECHEEEVKALKLRNLSTGGNEDLDKAHDDALARRREANIYGRAAQLSVEEIKEIRKAFLHRFLEFVERNHISHSATMKVKQEIGEPTASYDSLLACMDVQWDLAKKMIGELEGGKKLTQATRRSTPRQKK